MGVGAEDCRRLEGGEGRKVWVGGEDPGWPLSALQCVVFIPLPFLSFPPVYLKASSLNRHKDKYSYPIEALVIHSESLLWALIPKTGDEWLLAVALGVSLVLVHSFVEKFISRLGPSEKL